MSLLRKLPLKLQMFLASLVYFAVGAPIALWLQPDAGAFAAILPLFIYSPIFVFLAGWRAMEIRSGGPLIERYKPSNALRTKAQTQVERRASVLTVVLAVFFCLTPIAMAMQQGAGVNAFAPALVWSWLFYAFGLNRLRLPVIMMSSSRPHFATKQAQDFCMGFILTTVPQASGLWRIRDSRTLKVAVPAKEVSVEAVDGSHPRVILPQDAQMALLGILTKDGNPYRMQYAASISTFVDLDMLSSHAKIEIARTYAQAMARVPELRDT